MITVKHHTGVLLKFVRKEYVDTTIKGELFFGLAGDYIDLEMKQMQPGIGDKREGSHSRLIFPDKSRFFVSLPDEKPVELFFKQATHFKRNNVIRDVPICCFVFLSFKDDFVNNGENYEIKEEVLEELYEEFNEHEVLFISEPNDFLKEIQQHARNNEYNATFSLINYYNPRYEDYPISEEEAMKYPIKTLFNKREIFRKQREFRIILNKHWESGKCLNLGDMSDHFYKMSKKELKNVNVLKNEIKSRQEGKNYIDVY